MEGKGTRRKTESNANKYQINEDAASSFKLGMDAVKDPTVKKVLNGILECAMALLNLIQRMVLLDSQSY